MKKMMQKTKEQLALENVIGIYEEMLSTGKEDRSSRETLAKELYKLQTVKGSWSVINDEPCDSDVRVEYTFLPTYYATAALMHQLLVDGPDSIDDYAFRKGLSIAMQRRLAGHGYDAVSQRQEAMKIYKDAGVAQFINHYSKEYKEFTDMIKELTAASYVWYAAYGSNLSLERFMQYINRCTDKTAPLEAQPYQFAHSIYFAHTSRTWDGKGVAFLNQTAPGRALGRIYKITYEQLEEIQGFEGSKYSNRVLLGERAGLPVYTFTSPCGPYDFRAPAKAYADRILEGLKETYPNRTELSLMTYLYCSSLLTEDDRTILEYIRSSEHAVSLQDIADEVQIPPMYRVKMSIVTLQEHGLIRQDRASREAGRRITSQQAKVFTVKEKRELIDMLWGLA